MKTRILFLLLAVALVVGGCATRPVDPLVARRQAYERILKNIQPGMTRRQLYALLPPQRTPEVETQPGFPSPGTQFHREWYPLDRDFCVMADYHLANSRDYVFYNNAFLKRNCSARKGKPHPTAAEIDALLFPRSGDYKPVCYRSVRSRENLDDEIMLPCRLTLSVSAMHKKYPFLCPVIPNPQVNR